MAVKQTALVAKRPGRKPSPPLLQQAANAPSSTQPSIFCFDPKLAGPIAQWNVHLDRAVSLGFTHALLESPNVAIASWLANFDLVETFVRECAARRLKPLADIKINEDGSPSSLRNDDVIVPQILKPLGLSHDPDSHDDLISGWRPIVDRLVACGLSGVRCQSSFPLPLRTWHSIIRDRKLPADWISIGWLFDLPRDEKISALATFDFMPSSAAWWDGSASWLIEEYNELRPHGRLLAFPHDPLVRRRAPNAPQERLAECSFRIAASATLADGWLMPMGYEHGIVNSDLRVYTAPEDFAQLIEGSPIELTQQIIEANQRQKMLTDAAHHMRQIAHGSPLTAIHRPDRNGPGHMIAINSGDHSLTNVDLRRSTARIGAVPTAAPPQTIEAHSLVVVALQPLAPVLPASVDVLSIDAATVAPRIAIERITPTADDGRYAVKRTVGDIVSVEADIFSDGHDVLAAELTWRPGSDAPIQRMPMRLIVNDRWTAEFPLLRPGRHSFTIEAWLDRFGSFRRDLEKKISAGVDTPQDLAEGRSLVEAAIKRSKGALTTSLRAQLKKLDKDGPHAFLSPELLQLMHQADDRPFSTGRKQSFAVDADREAAAFASWYELFPRSMSASPGRHGTLRDVIGRLPAVRAMGFDVLYFPPIHPIGRRNRKGRNNTLTAGPDDPGSPYAIGSQEGGHEAIHPELGTFEDFQALVRAAHENGLEIALDFAIQCSPDHPWIKQHPEWFQWRPDGSMKYAENPPKKYEDIVNVDFYAEDAKPSLWLALRDIVQGWVDLGVRTFRVDNPHTKPFPFWEWLIGDIHTRDSGVIFLAEAFTRPKIMYRLGKVGFTQSYTYFTWRNTKAEIVEYITELMRPTVADVYRPHFFVNTPDINPYFLQTSGRAGFLIRAAMAATLSGLWGVYSGFELCEAAALPGREEYLDSEKYEIRVRDFNGPGNIISEITRLNAIRNAHAALQSHMHTSFYNANNDNILYFGKQVAEYLEIILVSINLDPRATQSATVEIPLWDLGLPDDASVIVDDLMTGNRFSLHGKLQTITLDPSAMPFAIWKLSPEGRP